MPAKEKTLHQKLCEIQAQLNAPKNQTNAFGKYKYRSCEDILEAVKPLLADRGCVLTFCDAIVVHGDRVYVEAHVFLSDGSRTNGADDFSFDGIQTRAFAREPLAKKGMDESQITGTASSYARKYACNALFLIDDCKDADTMDNRAHASDTTPAPAPAPVYTPPAGNINATEELERIAAAPAFEPEPQDTEQAFDDGSYEVGAVYDAVKKSLANFCIERKWKKVDLNIWIKGQYGGRTIAKMQNDDGLLLEVLKRVENEYAPQSGDAVTVGGVIPGEVV
jgi:hypothetical protein